MESHQTHKKHTRDNLIRNLVIVALVALFISETAVLIHDFHVSGPIQELHVHDRTPQPVKIEQWMTFRYINTLFNVPPSYLQSSLGITDIRYPDIGIHHYAKAHSIDPDLFAGTIEHAISNYETQ